MAALRPLTAKPLIVKLTPNVAEPATIAIAAEQGGADAVSLINTLKAAPLLVDGEPWLGAGSGGLSGPAVRTIALKQVADVAAAVEIPVVGMGGVERGSRRRDAARGGGHRRRRRDRQLPRSARRRADPRRARGRFAGGRRRSGKPNFREHRHRWAARRPRPRVEVEPNSPGIAAFGLHAAEACI